jgi:hypothetical protein
MSLNRINLIKKVFNCSSKGFWVDAITRPGPEVAKQHGPSSTFFGPKKKTQVRSMHRPGPAE